MLISRRSQPEAPLSRSTRRRLRQHTVLQGHRPGRRPARIRDWCAAHTDWSVTLTAESVTVAEPVELTFSVNDLLPARWQV